LVARKGNGGGCYVRDFELFELVLDEFSVFWGNLAADVGGSDRDEFQ